MTDILSASVYRRIAGVASALFGPAGAPCGALSTDPTVHDQLQRDEGSQPMTRLINRLRRAAGHRGGHRLGWAGTGDISAAIGLVGLFLAN